MFEFCAETFKYLIVKYVLDTDAQLILHKSLNVFNNSESRSIIISEKFLDIRMSLSILLTIEAKLTFETLFVILITFYIFEY